MNWPDTLLLIILGMLVLPVLAYMVMKFGAAGYYRAKRRAENSQNQNIETEQNDEHVE